MYKNASFFKRFFSNVFDNFLFISFSTVIFLIMLDHANQTLTHRIVSVVLVCVWMNVYFLILPLLLKGQTLGMKLFKLKLIDTNSKQFSYKLIFKRNIIGIFMLQVIFLLTIIPMCLQKEMTIKEFEKTNEFKSSSAFISALMTAWLAIHTIGYTMLIFYKKKLTLLDLMFNTRIVEDKQIQQVLEEEIVLLPFYNKGRKYRYVNKEENLWD
ncbi:RDD family protein [Mycoplasma sp. 2704]|uniref:RDD family protein n=1 Tax=unclassified Mycoplasma TaxID=2683645 RepID=UPI002B1DF00F|nr:MULTISPECIES: RDD family protein [unclassified Mycoplasma]MEA4134247.1 RDD family protein [Mycoplasma sp. 2704]MEA4333527.1 RDD family protein [Mycoplasma sp. 1232]